MTRADAKPGSIGGTRRALRASVARLVGRDRSALILPVPWAEPVVGKWRAMYDSSAADGMPAHITVLYPFLPSRAIKASVETTLRSIIGGNPPLRFRLERVERFSGVVYLAPEPSDSLVNLTKAIWTRWPEHPPYRGAYEALIPHLTVATGAEPPGLARELERALPIEGEVSEVCLMTKAGRGAWSVRGRFPLGG